MSDVLLERKNHTAVITIDKPETLNALCQDLIGQINRALDEVETDSQIYTIIITGTGRSFIAGADIGEMYEKDREAIRKWAVLGCDLNLRLETMALPVIAAINGYALGGGLELAMACDIRIASEKARMGLPETGLGVICGAGGTQRLPRIVGASDSSTASPLPNRFWTKLWLYAAPSRRTANWRSELPREPSTRRAILIYGMAAASSGRSSAPFLTRKIRRLAWAASWPEKKISYSRTDRA